MMWIDNLPEHSNPDTDPFIAIADRTYARLAEDLKTYLAEPDIGRVHSAYIFARDAHGTQTRSSGEPYITHPIEVTQILAGFHLDPESLMAALLHDVLEDTLVDKATLAEKFGNEVAELVDGVSKLTQIKFTNKAIAEAESFRKMLLAMVSDLRVILVKLADRLHNMRTVHHLPAARRKRIARETLEIHAPIANRLGLHRMRCEFEDLGLAALYPLRYRTLEHAIKRARNHRKQIIDDIELALRDCLNRSHLHVEQLWAHERHLYSIYDMMHSQQMSFHEIMDAYLFRIIVENVEECYRALGAVHNLYKPIPEYFKDFIAIPKSNGYQSLHTALFGPYGVPIKIQIRTREMDHIAEHGILAHWLFPNTNDARENSVLAQEWVKNLFELQQGVGDPLEFVENVKMDLFAHEIYVFTPKGDIIKLPRGATAVDFAYAVHSDIGHHCVSAKINRRAASLSTPLVSGQTVEVSTSPDAAPNPSWLNFVMTARAQTRIRHYLKTRRQSETIALGKRLLENALTDLSLKLEDIPAQHFQKILKESHFNTQDELFESAGTGAQLPSLLAKRLSQSKTAAPANEAHETASLAITGTEGVAVQYASCCQPIPGDPIVATFNEGKGLVIHVEQCPMIEALRNQKEPLIPVRWQENVSGDFLVDIYLEAINQRGILAAITKALADAGANIDDIRVTERLGQYYRVGLTLAVRDRTHLSAVIRRLRGLNSISRIYRNRHL